jgi:hypothetical protein
MTIVRSHYGQHSPDCYGCKLHSLTFDRGGPKRHQRKGDPWEGNPVKERIEELHAQGRRVAAYELSRTEGETNADV